AVRNRGGCAAHDRPRACTQTPPGAEGEGRTREAAPRRSARPSAEGPASPARANANPPPDCRGDPLSRQRPEKLLEKRGPVRRPAEVLGCRCRPACRGRSLPAAQDDRVVLALPLPGVLTVGIRGGPGEPRGVAN